jgi:hypothetical protein
MMHQTTIWILASGAIRILARPVFDFFYHKLSHHLIHSAGHRVGIVGKAFKRLRWLPDAAMIGALTILSMFTEGHEGHETSHHEK